MLDLVFHGILRVAGWGAGLVFMLLRREEALLSASERSGEEVARVNAWIRSQPDAVTMPPKRVDR